MGFTINISIEVSGVNPRVGLFRTISGTNIVTVQDLRIIGYADVTASGTAIT